MGQQDFTARVQSFDARTTAFGVDPLRANPIRAAVAGIRAMQNDLTPRQQAIRDYGRQQTAALLASGHYSV